jgi:hypothetical protein
MITKQQDNTIYSRIGVTLLVFLPILLLIKIGSDPHAMDNIKSIIPQLTSMEINYWSEGKLESQCLENGYDYRSHLFDTIYFSGDDQAIQKTYQQLQEVCNNLHQQNDSFNTVVINFDRKCKYSVFINVRDMINYDINIEKQDFGDMQVGGKIFLHHFYHRKDSKKFVYPKFLLGHCSPDDNNTIYNRIYFKYYFLFEGKTSNIIIIGLSSLFIVFSFLNIKQSIRRPFIYKYVHRKNQPS